MYIWYFFFKKRLPEVYFEKKSICTSINVLQPLLFCRMGRPALPPEERRPHSETMQDYRDGMAVQWGQIYLDSEAKRKRDAEAALVGQAKERQLRMTREKVARCRKNKKEVEAAREAAAALPAPPAPPADQVLPAPPVQPAPVVQPASGPKKKRPLKVALWRNRESDSDDSDSPDSDVQDARDLERRIGIAHIGDVSDISLVKFPIYLHLKAW